MTYKQAIKEAEAGQMIARESWPNKLYWIFYRDEKLMFYTPEAEGKYTPDAEDINATDWKSL